MRWYTHMPNLQVLTFSFLDYTNQNPLVGLIYIKPQICSPNSVLFVGLTLSVHFLSVSWSVRPHMAWTIPFPLSWPPLWSLSCFLTLTTRSALASCSPNHWIFHKLKFVNNPTIKLVLGNVFFWGVGVGWKHASSDNVFILTYLQNIQESNGILLTCWIFPLWLLDFFLLTQTLKTFQIYC